VETAVSHVEIDAAADDDALMVRWELAGEPVAMDVALGSSPNRRDHQHVATVAAGETTLRVARRPGVRLFASVAPHQADGGAGAVAGAAVVGSQRRIPFEAVTNFRDLGGYRTGTGQRVRWGQVFRSDALHGMTEGDLALYGELGVQAVYDLRGEVEVAERPNPMPSRHIPLLTRRPDDSPVAFEGMSSKDGEQVLAGIYIGHIDHAAATIGELLSALAEPGALPAVFHCHAGKDRTGLVAALLLDALGVERESILDDYELTARFRLRAQQDETFERLVNLGLAPEAAAGVLTAPRWAMAEALSHLDREYGSIEQYLTGPAAMKPADLQRLSAALLD
jgi:protein-tyrosine phosphatase